MKDPLRTTILISAVACAALAIGMIIGALAVLPN